MEVLASYETASGVPEQALHDAKDAIVRPELGCAVRCGFVVERIVFFCMRYDAHQLFDVKQSRVGQYFGVLRLKHEELDNEATSLLSKCRKIMETVDPVTYLRSSLDLALGKGIDEHTGSAAEQADEDNESCMYAEYDSGLLHREKVDGALISVVSNQTHMQIRK